MAENERLANLGQQPITTTSQPLSVETVKTQPVAPPQKLGTMSAADLSALERRMQLEPPKDVVLPGGQTLESVQLAQSEDADKREAAARKAETEMIESQAPALPDREVSMTADGQILSAPVSTGLEKEKPADSVKP
jgi:hypothetical protein